MTGLSLPWLLCWPCLPSKFVDRLFPPGDVLAIPQRQCSFSAFKVGTLPSSRQIAVQAPKQGVETRAESGNLGCPRDAKEHLSGDRCIMREDWGNLDDKDAELLGKQHDHLHTGVFKLWAQQSRAFYEHIIIWKDVCR